MLLSELKVTCVPRMICFTFNFISFLDEVDAKIVVAGISTTCSQKIHNQLQKTLQRANRHNQFCQNCWRIPQPRSSSTAGSMSRVETATAPTLARAPIRLSRGLTDFINKIKADENVLFDLSCQVHKYGKSTTGESWDIVAD
ncbi:uncharacterized protein LOC126630600 [Malus sylvestris]|uniref:uncharacterized protein LOC126630600 n=1 Tax=Malus sylvestris TaxID=3752 RepID=UPI0021AC3195|nr:uncharacterized protein LOC126630600 [Malus sylvestris]